MDRWERLERYSRWKQNRLRLDMLPGDVLLTITGLLSHADICNLLNALFSVPRSNLKTLKQAQLVPEQLRGEWLHGAACDALCHALHTMGDVAMFHAHNCTCVRAHVNWSVFTGNTMPMALCTYRWSPQRTACQEINGDELYRTVQHASCSGNSAISIFLYQYVLYGDNSWVMYPKPCHCITHSVFPHFLVSESIHGRASWQRLLNACVRGTHIPWNVPCAK